MIGKAIHRILKDKISELNSGGVFPVVMPQNANYSISSSTNYPSIVYHQYTDYETSKDTAPNIVFSRVMIQVISDTYNSVESISTKVRDVLDHYVDKSTYGLADVPGYIDGGYPHNFIENVDIQHIFYQEEEDEYFEKLEIYTRRIEYEVYYYDDIMKLSYSLKNSDGYTPTNPLALCFDFTQSKLMKTADWTRSIGNDWTVHYVINKLGRVKDLYTSSLTTGNYTYYEYLKYAQASLRPTWKDGTVDGTKGYLEFNSYKSVGLQNMDNSIAGTVLDNKFNLPYGGMVILVYKPLEDGGENYLLGANNEAANYRPLIISHGKDASSITIKIKPQGIEFDGGSSERTLISSTEGTKYWVGDYHYLCVSLGGSKNYTGGTVNQAGWFEYFNSNYNPKLTTGQILKNNTIAGNTDSLPADMPFNFSISRVGNAQVDISEGFGIYELLVFDPNEAQTHNLNVDAAPFQPTDIIYKKVKEYIYNKYPELK